MMATPNSIWLPTRAVPRMRALLPGLLLAAMLDLGADDPRTPATPGATMTAYRESATRQYHEARKQYRMSPDDARLAWQFGRATFDLAEVAHNKQERETLAQEGIDACRAAISREPDLAEAHYYLGMNLGQLARVYLLRGLRIVGEMERAFETARELDPRVDHGGSDRNLGLLYHQAPGWPISVGNKSKGRQHLERAVKLSPNHPHNRLSLAEALWDTNYHEEFLLQVRALEELLPKARETFDAKVWAWAWSWADWDRRWAELKARAATLAPPD